MSDEDAPSSPATPEPENVLGLDPRAVLGRIARERQSHAARRIWEPPSAEEIEALFPQIDRMELIGRGGMGAVYRARQASLDRVVAIKLLPVDAGADEEFAARFQAEARALAKLQHPNIVAIYDFGKTSAGHLFFVMEYVEGSDLAAVLREGGIAPGRAIEIVLGVCAALEFAHAQGIVHRDIKPANVLIRRDGAVKVADFGLARLRAEADAGATRLTLAGAAMGTPEYMAPEQRAGGDADGRADLYSVGVLLYEALTGRLPSGAWEAPSRVAGTDARLDAVVMRALQTDPAKRFQRVEELAAELVQAGRPQRSSKAWWAMAAALAVGAVLVWCTRDGGAAPGSGSAVNRKDETVSPVVLTDSTDLLRDMDLAAHVVAGEWRWLDDRIGGTAEASLTSNQANKWLRLPVRPGAHGYDLSCEVWLLRAGGDAGFILPAGAGRTHLVLDWFTQSGLEYVHGLQWKNNETTVLHELPQEKFFRVEIAVRPEGDQVSITVRIDGAPFIAWHGPQSDLTVMEDKQILHDGPGRQELAVTSFNGGMRVRDVKVRVAP